MFYKRKFYKTLLAWKEETGGKKAALIEGARRIGKSTLVQEFGKNEYKSVLVIDFAKASDAVKEWFKTQIDKFKYMKLHLVCFRKQNIRKIVNILPVIFGC